MTPSEVNKSNRKDALRGANHKFSVGDKTRINKAAYIFRKGYLPSWTEEIFTISKQLPTYPPTYAIKDYNNQELKGYFYESELNIVHKTDELYSVEKVLRKRKIRGKTQYFVKWLGYPPSFNSYVEEVV
jgi:hypothetical protein